MSEKHTCKGCHHEQSIEGCASHHIEMARNLISEGNIKEADESLKGIQQHLKK